MLVSVSDRQSEMPLTSAARTAAGRWRGRRLLASLSFVLVALGLLVPSLAAATTADQATAFQLDPAHDGNLTGAPLTTPLTQAWTITLSGETAISYPLIVNGVVYVTARGSGQGGTLYALDQATGSTLWSHALGGTGWSGLTYDAGQVFTVDTAGTMTAFNAATGATDWSLPLPGQYLFSSAPTASNGYVYTGGAGTGGTLYAVSEANGQLAWSQSVENGDDSSPAVDSGAVYVNYAGNQDYAFDAATGTPIWHYSTGTEGGGGATPVVAAGYVFTRDVGGSDLILSTTAGTSAGSYSSTPPPAVGGGEAYTLSGSTLTAINGSGVGTNAWTFTGDGNLVTSPLIVGSLVFEGSSSGNVYAVNSSGSSTWSANVGAAISGPNSSSVQTGLGAGEGTLIIPAGNTLVAYEGANVGSGTPANSTAPTIVGTPQTGQALGADVGTWTALPTGYTYQWQLCDASGASCNNIGNATSASYMPSGADPGSTLRVQITATNGSGTSAPVTSAASAVIALDAPTALAAPTISGSPLEGHTLSASTGTWTGSPTSYSYEWLWCDAPTDCFAEPDATSSTYVVDPSDIGLQIEVQVTATNAAGSSTATSPLTSAVTTLGPQLLVAPAISGAGVVGQPLSTSDGVWTGNPTSYDVQWNSCDSTLTTCNAISGATGSTYTPQSSDVGRLLSVTVTAINGFGVSDVADSDSVGPITASSSSALGGLAYLSIPEISGALRVGSPETATSGTWTEPAAFAYQWQLCAPSGSACSNITGATTAQFTPTQSMLGDTLEVDVKASSGGSSEFVASRSTAPIAGPAAAAAGPGTSSGASGPAGSSPATTTALAALGVRLGTTGRVRDLIHRGLSAEVHCTAACHVTMVFVATPADRGLKGRVGAASARLRAGETTIVTVTPIRRDDAALARLARVTLDLDVAVNENHSTRRFVEQMTIRR